MATKRTLEFEILAETKKATKDLTKLRGELTKFDKNIKKTQKSNKGFSTSFGNLAAVTAGFVSLQAAINGISSAIGTIADFEVQIDKLGAISKASTEELSAMEEEAKRLGETTQYTASQVADAMTFLAMAGFDVKDILASTEGVLNLATIGMMDLGEAADIASNILTGFGLSAEETDRVVDVLAETITSSNTNVQELGSAMSKVAPVAASLNMSLEETAAALGVMADAGIKAELAGTQLKMALLQLSTDSKAKAALKEMGVDAYDAEGKFKGLIQIVKEMKPALSNMSQEARNAALVDVFGKRAVASANIFIDKLDSIEEKYQANAESAGVAQKMAEQFMSNLTGAYKEFKSALEGVILEFSGTLIPILEEATDASTEWLRSLDEDDLEAFKHGIEAFGKGLGALVNIISKVIDAISWLNDVAMPDWLAGSENAGYFGTVLEGLSLGLTKVGNDLEKMGNHLDKSGDQWERLTERTKEGTDLLNQAGKFDGSLQSFKNLEKGIQSAIDKNKAMIEEWKKKDPEVYAGLINNLTYKTKLLEDGLKELQEVKPHEAQKESAEEAGKAEEELAEKVKKYSNEELVAHLETAEKRKKSTEDTMSSLAKQEEKLVADIEKMNEKLAQDLKKISLERLKTNQDITSSIRDLERGLLTDKNAYIDQQKEAELELSKAKDALQNEELEKYRVHINKYKALKTESAGEAIKENGKIVISQEETTKNAIEGLNEVRRLENGYYDVKEAKRKALHEQQVSQQKAELELIRAQLTAQEALMKALEVLVEKMTGNKLKLDYSAIIKAKETVNDLIENVETLNKRPIDIQAPTKEIDTAKDAVKDLGLEAKKGATVVLSADGKPLKEEAQDVTSELESDPIIMTITAEDGTGETQVEIKSEIESEPAIMTIAAEDGTVEKQVEIKTEIENTPAFMEIGATDKTGEVVTETITLIESKSAVMKVDADTTPAEKKIPELEKSINATKIEVEVLSDTKKAESGVKGLVKDIGKQTPQTQDVIADVNGAYRPVWDFLEWVKSQKPVITLTVKVDASAAYRAIREIQKSTKSNHTIHVYEQKHYAQGGFVDGTRKVKRFASGGHFTGSGRVPGDDPTNSDKVTAMLTGGEYVVKRSAVKNVGVPFLENINNLNINIPKKYASGGLVDGVSSAALTATPEQLQPINLHIGNKTFETLSPKDVGLALHRYLESEGGM